jgi:hypothetical protein
MTWVMGWIERYGVELNFCLYITKLVWLGLSFFLSHMGMAVPLSGTIYFSLLICQYTRTHGACSAFFPPFDLFFTHGVPFSFSLSLESSLVLH